MVLIVQCWAPRNVIWRRIAIHNRAVEAGGSTSAAWLWVAIVWQAIKPRIWVWDKQNVESITCLARGNYQHTSQCQLCRDDRDSTIRGVSSPMTCLPTRQRWTWPKWPRNRIPSGSAPCASTMNLDIWLGFAWHNFSIRAGSEIYRIDIDRERNHRYSDSWRSMLGSHQSGLEFARWYGRWRWWWRQET